MAIAPTPERALADTQQLGRTHGAENVETAKRPRGRPPSPGGPKSQAEIQRAYRARLAA
jgi:hypothetical protein